MNFSEERETLAAIRHPRLTEYPLLDPPYALSACNHTYDLLIQALAAVQSYREMTHALLDALHNANKLAKRHRDTMKRGCDTLRLAPC